MIPMNNGSNTKVNAPKKNDAQLRTFVERERERGRERE